MRTLDKFMLLMWKNWKLQFRQPISLAIEVGIPLLVIVVLLIMRRYIEKGSVSAISYDQFRISGEENLKAVRAYSPDDNTFINELMEPFKDAKRFPNGKKMEEYLTSPELIDKMSYHFFIGIQFEEKMPQTMPKDIVITFRVPYTDWHTGQLYPPYSIGFGSRSLDSYNGNDSPYNHKFIQLMYMMTNRLLEKSGKTGRLPDMYLQGFPYPEYEDDDYLKIMSQNSLFAYFFMAAFLYACTNMTKSITYEKEKQLKESMKIMGLPTWLHWTAWFCKMIIPFLIIAIVMVVMMKWNTVNGRMLERTDWSPLFVFFLLFVCSMITFCFALSVFFTKATRAAAVAAILWVLFLVPYIVIRNGNYQKSSSSLKYFSSLSITCAMAYVFDIIIMYEAQQEGVQWSNLFNSNDQMNISFGGILLMMCFDVFFYLLIALYVEAIYPGEFGVPQKWYFFMKRDFWCNSKKEDNDRLPSVQRSEYFEEDPTDLKPGVQMRNLYKSFGSTEAVKGVSLNLYENQITVLLGHNGAGKTTTMSMLTGMFPPTRGTAIINGYDVRTQTMAVRDSMGLCLQHNVLFDQLKVREHLIFFSRLKGCKGDQVNREVNKFLKLLRLEDKAEERSTALSGGMKRKLCVGIALCGNSKIIMLDEPTAGMDPSARRFIWEFLQKQKKGRTILLTTHFMDEADLLGDRIAIMSGGVLQCCGSSFFLKKKYGTGYYLIIDKMPNCNPNNITDVLRKYIRNVKIQSNTGTELTYLLPENYASKFTHMLAELENKSSNLGIRSFGISVADLEEVFMKVGTSETERALAKTNDTPDNGLNNNSNIGNTVQGTSLLLNQSLAMWLKKMLSVKRTWGMELLKLVVPVLFVALVLSSEQLGSDDIIYNARSFDLAQYKRPITLVETNGLLQQSYVDFLKGMNQQVEITSNMTGRILSLASASPSLIKYRYVVGASFTANSSYAWFNNEMYHSMPLSVQLLLQNHYKYILGKDYNINFVNYPLPNTATKSETEITEYIFGGLTTISLSIVMAYIGTFYILFNIKERMSQSKHLQFVSGVNVCVFRFVSFACDFLTYVLPCVAILITFAIIQPVGMSTSEELGFLTLLLFSFGVVVMPWMYLFSFAFTVPSTGYSRMFFLSFITGFPCVMIIVIMTNVKWKFATLTDWILRIFPHYNFIVATNVIVEGHLCTPMIDECSKFSKQDHCIRELCEMIGCCDPTVFSGISKNLRMMYIVAVLTFLLILLVDYKIISNVIYATFKEIRNPPKPLEYVDPDVLEENNYVKTSSIQEMQSQYALILRDLTKHYRRITAVNGLNLTVKKAECFGLLGVNGAGKTTTFKMMTGDEMISYGDGWINGYSIKNEMKKVHCYIGYCPQFDALLDNLTARETLKIFCLLRGIPRGKSNFTAEKLARDFDFTEHLDKEVRQMSGGNKRKLSTAIALVGDAPVIFLDEPTTGMDPATKRHLWNNLTNIRESGKSIILTSHSMEECEALCTRLAIMVNGNFQCLGSTQHLKSKFAQGYSVTLKVRKPDHSAGLEHADTADIEHFMQQNFPTGELREKHQELLTYVIKDENLTWSKLFGILEMAKGHLDIEDYSVGQASLEQVFLTFTKKQFADEEGNVKNGCFRSWCC